MTKHTQMLPTFTHGAEKRTWWSMSFLASFHVFRWTLRSRCGGFFNVETLWKLCRFEVVFQHLQRATQGKAQATWRGTVWPVWPVCFCKMILGSWLFVFAFSYYGPNKTHIKIESKMNRASINKLCVCVHIYIYIYIYVNIIYICICNYIVYIYICNYIY